MRQQLLRFVLVVSLVASAGSLMGNAVSAGNGPGCCVCSDCGNENGTMNGTVMGRAPADTVCADAFDPSECEAICAGEGCLASQFENATCSDPSLADACGAGLAPVPTTSAFGLMALVAFLLGFGTFLLRQRRA